MRHVEHLSPRFSWSLSLPHSSPVHTVVPGSRKRPLTAVMTLDMAMDLFHLNSSFLSSVSPTLICTTCLLTWYETCSYQKWSEVKWSEVKVAQSCLTLCNPIDCTVHGILQVRMLEWVAVLFSTGSSQPRDRTQVYHIAGRFFTSWATREAQEYWVGSLFLLQWIFLTKEWTGISCIAGRFFTSWAIREAHDTLTRWNM